VAPQRQGRQGDQARQRRQRRGQRHPAQLLAFGAAGVAVAHRQRAGGHHDGQDGDRQGDLVGDQQGAVEGVTVSEVSCVQQGMWR